MPCHCLNLPQRVDVLAVSNGAARTTDMGWKLTDTSVRRHVATALVCWTHRLAWNQPSRLWKTSGDRSVNMRRAPRSVPHHRGRLAPSRPPGRRRLDPRPKGAWRGHQLTTTTTRLISASVSAKPDPRTSKPGAVTNGETAALLAP